MNEKFFALPQEKRQRIIQAGYHVFSKDTYKHCSMNEIAAEALISKSLLFHYFKNKIELYLFLWEHCAEITMDILNRYQCYETTDLFEAMERGMKAKIEMMRLDPKMSYFAIRAFYEKDEQICSRIQESYHKYFDIKAQQFMLKLDPSDFLDGLDLAMMFQEMQWTSLGYLWEMLQKGELNVSKMEEDFARLMDFWKTVYLKKKECRDGSH